MSPLTNPLFLALKAALASSLALAVVEAFGLTDRLSATFSALACVTPVVFTGMRRGIEQIAASALGGLFTWAALTVLPHTPVALALAMAATVYAAFRVGIPQAYLVAGFTVLYVFILPADTPGLALERRLLALAVGVASAAVVNTVISVASYRAIFLQRLRIVRDAHEGAWRTLAERLRDPSRLAEAPLSFDPVFPLLWALGAELGDARREGKVRRTVHAELDALQVAVRTLALLSHLGKELGLHATELSPAEANARAALIDLIPKLVEGEPVSDIALIPKLVEGEPVSDIAVPEGEWGRAWLRARAAAVEAAAATRAAGLVPAAG